MMKLLDRRAMILDMALGGLALLSVPPAAAQAPSRVGAAAPEITAGRWINSAPLTLGGLRGRVVALEFWTFA